LKCSIQSCKRICFFFILFLFIFANLAYSDPDTPEVEQAQLDEGYLFVSLGSNCGVAGILRASDLRNAAFPFDWMVTYDGEKFIELLDNDFAFFLDPKYLHVEPSDPGYLIQTYYHMEFLHEGDFRGQAYISSLEKLQSKCERRIERFRQLKNYSGKVTFIRSSYIDSLIDPHIYVSNENIELTDDYSIRLYESLKIFFPKLNFTLIILNTHDGSGIIDERKITDHVIQIRSNLRASLLENVTAFKQYILSSNKQALTDSLVPVIETKQSAD